jgi:phosphatidylserine decarboxylase
MKLAWVIFFPCPASPLNLVCHVILWRMPDSGAPLSQSPVSGPLTGQEPESSLTNSPQPLRGLRRALLGLLYLLPKNGMSRMMGRFASLELPPPIQQAEIRLFARLAGVDLAEAREPVGEYRSLQAFFTRALKEGARPIEGNEGSIVSPCDGAWGASGRIEFGTLIQVKGRPYSVADLIGDEGLADCYEGGCFATFYLSPRDYHRFHTPVAGDITRLDYHPGALWPVNSIGLQGIDGLFARNERICAFLIPARSGLPAASPSLDAGLEEGRDTIALVAVGATMVGSVKLNFDPLTTNVGAGHRVTQRLGDQAPTFKRGEEWGHFEFGSTIVMLTPPDGFSLDFRPLGEPLRLGQVIGQRVR